jgi:hypothetical protein
MLLGSPRNIRTCVPRYHVTEEHNLYFLALASMQTYVHQDMFLGEQRSISYVPRFLIEEHLSVSCSVRCRRTHISAPRVTRSLCYRPDRPTWRRSDVETDRDTTYTVEVIGSLRGAMTSTQTFTEMTTVSIARSSRRIPPLSCQIWPP